MNEFALTKGERTRAKVLISGRHVFGRDGYGRSRMSDIAHEAGLSQGAIYRYFRNKDEVFRAVLGDLDRRLLDASRAESLFHEEPERTLYQANFGYLNLYWENRDIFRAFHEAAANNIRYQELWEEMRARFRARFLHVLQSSTGVKPDRKLEVLTLAMQCCIESFAYVNFAESVGPGISPPVDVREAAQVTSDVWFDAFRDLISCGRQDMATETVASPPTGPVEPD